MSDQTPKDVKPTSEIIIVETAKARSDTSDGSPKIPDGAALPQDKSKNWKDAGVLQPVISPEELLITYRKSAEVPKNARARGQNTSGYGWTLESTVDWTDPKLEEQAALWIFMDRMAQYRRDLMAAVESGKDIDEVEKPERPTEVEVTAEIAAWKERSILERAELEVRIETLCIEKPFSELIRRTEMNKSATAYCGWEIIRDAMGVPRRAKLHEAVHMRATPLGDPVWVPTLRKVTPISYEEIQVETSFRQYVIKTPKGRVWFKEFGDPRVVSQQTGQVYEDEDAFEAEKGKKEPKNAKPATEMIVWAEYSPGAEPYGMVIWHGHALDVTTTRKAKEFDYEELADSKMPRGIFSLVDSDIESPVIEGFKKFLRESGNNRNRFAILRMATTSVAGIAGAAGRAIFDFKDLSPAQKDEATHLKMKVETDEGVAGDFGNPGTYIGRTKDLQNRATAETAQHVAEQQTYRTLRKLWENDINTMLVLPWGFRFWKFKLNAPKQQRLAEMSGLLKALVDSHIISPAQAVPIAAELLGVDLPEAQRWQMAPPKLVQSGLLNEIVPPEEDELGDEGEEEEGDRAPGEMESDMSDADSARGILESLGVLAGTFMDGPAQKIRKRLGLSRLKRWAGEEDEAELGPDLLPEDYED